jgi:hypothetical protein
LLSVTETAGAHAPNSKAEATMRVINVDKKRLVFMEILLD